MDVAAAREIVHALRSGLVPRRGLEQFATGLEPLLAVVGEELDFVVRGNAASKWVRGEYGTGKTFASRLLCARARDKAGGCARPRGPVRGFRSRGALPATP